MTPEGRNSPRGIFCCLLTFAVLAAAEPVLPAHTIDVAQRVRHEFADPPQHYWPRPLWFWNNTRVTADEIIDQMRQARDRCKYGGFGILPFGRDFAPAYLSEEYFKVYGAALDKAKVLGLTLSLYDEYGFPSGSAGSQNSSDTSLFAQRWPELTIKRLDKHEWEIIGPRHFQTNLPPGQLAALVAMNTDTLERVELCDRVRDGALDWNAPAGEWKLMAFVCVIDGDPICDYLDPEAADRFIVITHQAYYNRFKDHFGTTIDSTFFDEPTMYRAQGRTWTDRFNEKFVAGHGFDPRRFYPALWYDIGPETQSARNFLFGFRTELYATGFTKRIQDWCDAHGITATGHQDQEEVLNPVSVSGDLMKCFKHLAIPGIDKIGGDRPAERFYKVVSSAAYNYDRHLVMSETYGAMGDLSWNEIYTVAMEQYTKGINLLIPHAVWYDDTQVTFKPELSWRHPVYAPRLPEFNTYLARLNVMLQTDDAHVADIAVLYPIATLQGGHYFDGPLGHYQGGVAVPEADYIEVGELLSTQIGRDFTYLHPEVLLERCSIRGGEIRLGNRVQPGRFSVLILPGHKTISQDTMEFIRRFNEGGGSIIATGELPSKSAEGLDLLVARAVESMFGSTESSADSAVPFSIRRNERDGCAIRLHRLNAESLQAALDAARSDYDVAFEPGRAMRYIHKHVLHGDQHIYFLANLDPKLEQTTVTLRGRHELESWNPHTGVIEPIQLKHSDRAGTTFTHVPLQLPHLQSVFLVSTGGVTRSVPPKWDGGAHAGLDSALLEPKSTHETRPWAYNWWLGSAVDTNNLARELCRYRDAGLGGIHVIPIYGAKGAESRYLEYLSPAWFETFQFCVEEAGRLGLGVDLTTGSGWCFGGPNVPKTDGGWSMRTSVLEPAPGQPFTNRWDSDSVIALVAVTPDQRQLDLRNRLRPDGSLDWHADEPGTTFYAVTAAPEGRLVKRAAPGGAGPMINPFSRQAMTNYLARFTDAFASYRGSLPHAMYHDSYEYNSNWTPDLLDAFARFRGYRLEAHWPEFCQDPRSNELTARLRADYQETLSDLMVEEVFPEWIRWCQARGIRTRNQAHGSPANLLDLYALADIPETEMFGRGTRDPLLSRFDERFGEGDRDPLISKFASSAAHTAGRKLVAAETGTWLAEHFCETLEELKCLVDLLFVSGVNHVVYHGTCYSPDDAAWPGWLFYASTQMNRRNAIWRDAPILNGYIERCQAWLQSGQPDNDVLLYWPLHDLWQTESGLITPLGVHRPEWLTGQPVGLTARHLWNRGFGFDYVSDRQLAPADVTDTGRVQLPGADYAVVLVPPTRWMPVDTLRRLIDLAERGGTILFEDHLPQDVPGAAILAERQAEMKDLLARLNFPATDSLLRQVTVRHGRVLVGELEAMLVAARVPRETICDEPGVRFIRRRIDEGRITFFVNQSMRLVDGWFPLTTPARSVVLMDALSNEAGRTETRMRDDGILEVRIRLEPGHSILMRTVENRDVGRSVAWSWPVAGAETIALTGPWQVEFIEGGPVLPKAYQTDTLRSWTQNGETEMTLSAEPDHQF